MKAPVNTAVNTAPDSERPLQDERQPKPEAPPSRALSTREQLAKIPGVPCLYRHQGNGSYYGIKKHKGKILPHALKTAAGEAVTERKLAEKALKAWIEALENPAPKDAGMSFSALLEKLRGTLAGHSESTREKIAWVTYCFEKAAPALLTARIDQIKPSHLSEFFAERKKTLGAHSLNELSRIVKNAFELAVNDEILPASPYAKVPKKIRRAKVSSEPAKVPTIEQCEKIVAHIRSQRFADTAEVSADMLEFIHKAALGIAECVYADWARVNWEKKYIEVKRQKTGAYFRVPFYEHLEPFLKDLHKRAGSPKKGLLFSIKSPKQALYNACRRLSLTSYSPIDFRKARIVWMLRKGVTVEQLAKWQGHKDNGVLLRRTYTWIISEADSAFEEEQLNKLSEKPAPAAKGKSKKKAAAAKG